MLLRTRATCAEREHLLCVQEQMVNGTTQSFGIFIHFYLYTTLYKEKGRESEGATKELYCGDNNTITVKENEM